ncbi:MAG TPA: 1,4-alpha-glucan branching protein domain-containing protein, partial [Chthoniobacterales bacterium]|jgi:1,4-alpha-glucan branching enzyme
MMQRLVRDEVPFKISMTVTPTLCAMLQDELLCDRYVRYLDRSIDLAEREIERNRDDDRLRLLAEFYHGRFCDCRHRLAEEWNGDLLEAFRQLRDANCLELIASAATHGLLPLLQQSTEAVRTQVQVGCDVYRATFDADPAGFWLPECAYAPGLEKILQEANLRWFILDAHGLMFGQPRPRRAIYAPCYTPAGPTAFARDRDSSRQVWSATEGYPGDPAYREFYRDIGFDLPPEYIRPGAAPHPPKFSGIKYHRITGGDCEKELYDPAWAESAADAHASHFFEVRRAQMDELRTLGFDPIVVVPFDAELFGHWWFEGPRFLESFIRKAAYGHQDLRLTSRERYGEPDFLLTTPTAFLASHSTQQTIQPAASSWGDNGYLGVWLDQSNAWIYPHLHSAARRMTEIARAHIADDRALTDRALKQLARELLLAQSSDWAFLMKTGTARQYATKRVTDHVLRFNRLHEQFTTGNLDEAFLSNCEWRDNLFPDVNWRYYT